MFSGDSENLVSVGRDSVAQVWRVQTGERRFSLQGHEHPLRGLAAKRRRHDHRHRVAKRRG